MAQQDGPGSAFRRDGYRNKQQTGMTVDIHDETYIHVNSAKTFVLVVGGALLTLACVLTTLEWGYPRRYPLSPVWRTFAMFGALGFGVGTILQFNRLFRPRPVLMFSKEGISIYDPPHRVPWSEVLDAGVVEFGGQEHFVVTVKNPAAYKENINSGPIMENIDRYNAPIIVNLLTITMSYDDLAEVFNRYRKIYGSNPSHAESGA